jgi:hypothetical protein
MSVTFATCWYALTSKFPAETYLQWMRHLLGGVNHFYLVLFTDEAGAKLLKDHFVVDLLNTKIKIVIKPCEEWYTYKYKSDWEKNHVNNSLLNDRTEWRLNMLWSEKTHFVNDARVKQYFQPTEFYGWCDIGYFRDGLCPPMFAHKNRLSTLNKNKIYYACVNPKQLKQVEYFVKWKNPQGLPMVPIPPEQCSIAGGFFIAHHSKIEGWAKKFDEKLALYFKHEYLVKDDQIIIVDCILSEPQRFEIIQEPDPKENPWFTFRRGLTPPDPH